MNVDILRLLFDFGLMTMIWMVQLIIYPSFLYYEKKALRRWHDKYTFRISYIIVPLMFGQLGLSIFQLLETLSIYSIGSFILIMLIWGDTLIQFVPMHTKITVDNFEKEMLSRLIKRNWFRTFLWTALFLWSMLCFLV